MVDDGPLTKKVLQYSDTIRQVVPSARTPDDWAPVAELVAVDEFERVGTFLEVQDWQQYTVGRVEHEVHRVGGPA